MRQARDLCAICLTGNGRLQFGGSSDYRFLGGMRRKAARLGHRIGGEISHLRIFRLADDGAFVDRTTVVHGDIVQQLP
jgi:hypothetical protein